jgi:hypothetical protein
MNPKIHSSREASREPILLELMDAQSNGICYKELLRYTKSSLVDIVIPVGKKAGDGAEVVPMVEKEVKHTGRSLYQSIDMEICEKIVGSNSRRDV